MSIILGLDIGSNSVGSAWIDTQRQSIDLGVSIFPAGVDESDDQRGEPKNAKRRQTRRTRITLARRSERKRRLRQKLIQVGLLPPKPDEFKVLLETANPWTLRRQGLDRALSPYEFGRVLLHLAQRRGALGLRIAEMDPSIEDPKQAANDEEGKVKAAIGQVRCKMLECKARTFGEFMEMMRLERTVMLTSEDHRPPNTRRGPREYGQPILNKAGSYEHCADRPMIRDEFDRLWKAQLKFGGPTAKILKTDGLRDALDSNVQDSAWQHRGLLFGQRRQSWDLGTLGRCSLEPTERCAPHADRYASAYRMIETVNNLKIIDGDNEARALTPDERQKIKDYLSGPLGMEKARKKKGQSEAPGLQPKRTVSVTDLRELMGWGRATKHSTIRFNIESDEDREINTDWFNREIVHGAVTLPVWDKMDERIKEGLNHAILKYDPESENDETKLKQGVMTWAGLNGTQADALIAAWRKRPKLEKRLKMSRRAVRNLLELMDPKKPLPDPDHPGQSSWLTQIAARKLIAQDAAFRDVTTGQPLTDHARRRYATGVKGATARDRHYMQKHLLKKNGQPVLDANGQPLHEPPPAPMISNPVTRKAIHEVRRHLIEYMKTFGRKPDEIHVELSRQARMGKKDADDLLFRNRLRDRIRKNIVDELELGGQTGTQQRTAVERVILWTQQGGICPLCGERLGTAKTAAYKEECELAHILPRACGGHNGLRNMVLAHTKCNREMGRQTPRQFWATKPGGFEQGMQWVVGIYGKVERIKFSEVKKATGDALWNCYFTYRDDQAKIAQFKKEIKDIQEMTEAQAAATKYAARLVMAYLADAVYDGQGLPERGGDRLIYATDGLWTSRFRREWGLFFDPHEARTKGLSESVEQERQEKNRGDHRHHAIDAAIIALCSGQMQRAWDQREQQAEVDGFNTMDSSQMEAYRKTHPLPLPRPFKNREELRQAIFQNLFQPDPKSLERPVSHRQVKRKLIGALHQETLLGPVLDRSGKLTENFVSKKSILNLDPNHLRMPVNETKQQAIERLTLRRMSTGADKKTSRQWAEALVASPAYHPIKVDPSPGKSGIVRDLALRQRLRQCLEEARLNPDDFTANELKKAVEAGYFKQASGVPIKSMVLLRTMNDPVVTSRWATDHVTGKRYKLYDAATGQGDAKAARAYVGGNNHHIEIRVTTNKKGEEKWSGEIISMYEAAHRKRRRLQAMRDAGIPTLRALRKLPPSERAKYADPLREIEKAHPLVDRRDNENGRFVMSLCEGETLMIRRKNKDDQPPGEPSYFVVAKLDKPQTVVLVPHWDARSATQRKDSQGKPITHSSREQFGVVPNDLKKLAPPDHPHAMKVHVSPLGKVSLRTGD